MEKIKKTTKKKIVSKNPTKSLLKKNVKKAGNFSMQKKKTATIAASKKDDLMARRNRIIIYRIKRLFYMFLSVFLGVLVSGFVLGLVEMIIMKNAFRMGENPSLHHFLGINFFLNPLFLMLIFGAGVAFGIWLGFWGWRVVYIEKRHRMFQKK